MADSITTKLLEEPKIKALTSCKNKDYKHFHKHLHKHKRHRVSTVGVAVVPAAVIHPVYWMPY